MKGIKRKLCYQGEFYVSNLTLPCGRAVLTIRKHYFLSLVKRYLQFLLFTQKIEIVLKELEISYFISTIIE